MNAPPRHSMSTMVSGAALRAEVYLSGRELAAAVGITPAGLARLVRLGLVEPTTPEAQTFAAATAPRLRRMLRLHHDLEVSLTAAAIIVDLLERLERLEGELARRRDAT
jgi:chaperone modulatory protein CbpM